MQSRLISSDVTIIESKIEIEFFLKIELNQNRFFGSYFFDFDSQLYWRRQRTAPSSKHDSWAVAKSAEYADLIIRIPCRSGRGGRAVRSPRPLQGVVQLSHPPLFQWPNLSSPLPVLRGRATGCTWYLHPRVL